MLLVDYQNWNSTLDVEKTEECFDIEIKEEKIDNEIDIMKEEPCVSFRDKSDKNRLNLHECQVNFKEEIDEAKEMFDNYIIYPEEGISQTKASENSTST